VLLCRDRCRLRELRAVVVNSGNANAATGPAGYEHAAAMQAAAARACGVEDETLVAVASTGVIGVPLALERVLPRIDPAAPELRPGGEADFAAAITTTASPQKAAGFDGIERAWPGPSRWTPWPVVSS